MKRMLAGLLLAVIGGGIWYGLANRGGDAAAMSTAPTDAASYDFEAQDVQVTQMGPDGRIRYQLQAKRIAQSLESGEVRAEDLTIHHDPPGTEPAGPNRWTVTAKGADLPPQAEQITLAGDIHVSGVPRGRKIPVVLRTEQLTYDVAREEIATSSDFLLEWGASTFTGRGLKVNFNTTEWAVESEGHGNVVR
jgi:LPS export ABC transporter protein LptC